VRLKTYLMDPGQWLLMYGAAGVGWLILWISPWIAALFLKIIYQGIAVQLDGLQRHMEEEWGSELQGD
jgi:hypothetical protein